MPNKPKQKPFHGCASLLVWHVSPLSFHPPHPSEPPTVPTDKHVFLKMETYVCTATGHWLYENILWFMSLTEDLPICIWDLVKSGWSVILWDLKSQRCKEEYSLMCVDEICSWFGLKQSDISSHLSHICTKILMKLRFRMKPDGLEHAQRWHIFDCFVFFSFYLNTITVNGLS